MFTFNLLSCVNNYFRNCGDDDVIIELSSSDEMYIDVSAQVTKGMEARGHLQDLRERPPYIEIPDKVVWETYHEARQGPFQYFIPSSNVR